jgi:ABC-type uncharacterized transport system permease subunit
MAIELAPAAGAGAVGAVERFRGLLATLIAVLAGLLIGGLALAAAGAPPLAAYGELVRGALGSSFGIYQSLEQAVPLAIIGIGLCVAFRAGIWNIGAEGQFYMGALCGGLVAIYLPVDQPALMIPVTFAAAMLGGSAWAYIAGWLRAHRGVNEIVSTLMLNYIGLFVLLYLVRIPFRDPDNLIIQSRVVSEAARLNDLPGTFVHAGIVVALLLVPIVWWLLHKTPFGFRVSVMGLNPDAAEAAGVDTKKTIKRVMLISGALAGLAGIVQVSAVQLVVNGAISRQFGFTAIVVALLGRRHPVGAFLAAVFLGMIAVGGVSVQQVYQIPTAILLAVQALFVFLLLAAERLMRR